MLRIMSLVTTTLPATMVSITVPQDINTTIGVRRTTTAYVLQSQHNGCRGMHFRVGDAMFHTHMLPGLDGGAVVPGRRCGARRGCLRIWLRVRIAAPLLAFWGQHADELIVQITHLSPKRLASTCMSFQQNIASTVFLQTDFAHVVDCRRWGDHSFHAPELLQCWKLFGGCPSGVCGSH